MNTDHRITATLKLRQARQVVVFTGAGVSAESGVPTFRDADGFWKRFPPDVFATWKGLLKTALTAPRHVVDFVWHVVSPIARAAPNPAHYAIARLGEHVATTVVTQNIDGLLQAAGANHVLEIHGTLLDIVNVSTGELVVRLTRDHLQQIADRMRSCLDGHTSLPVLYWQLRRTMRLDWRGRHRPNLVLFGDALSEPDWTEARQAVELCDVLISVGTSGEVYPAAMLPDWAAGVGATVISIDPHERPGCWLRGTAAVILPQLVDDAFGRNST